MSGAHPPPPPPNRANAVDVETAARLASELVDRLEGSTASHVELVVGDVRLAVELTPGVLAASLGQAPPPPVDVAASPEIPEPAVVVTAPLIGTFYRRRDPTEDPLVEVGDLVEVGQVVAIVEAMKMMNDVIAEAAGTVSAIHAYDGELVEFDQPLVSMGPR